MTRTCAACRTTLTFENYDRTKHPTLCLACNDAVNVANDHYDGHHDDAPEADCPMCDAVIEATCVAMEAPCYVTRSKN